MKTILMIGKMNELVKDIHDHLKKQFRVQICGEDLQNAIGMLKVVEPDLVLISLVGLYDLESSLFGRIVSDYPKLPVITIGTKGEADRYLKYYENDQFENLVRPIDNKAILDAICRRLALSGEQYLAEEPSVEEKSGRKRVLVVDDDMMTLRSIKGMLEKHYEITLANSGMKAMTSIGKKRPDIILLDYEMPVCDGKQTLEMIRADEDLKDIPVVFLTGVNEKEHIKAVLSLNPARYLLKPAVQQTLIDTIEMVLQ